MKKEQHRNIVEEHRTVVDEAGKTATKKMFKGVSLKEIIQSPKTAKKKYLKNIIPILRKNVLRVKASGIRLGEIISNG